MLYCIYFSIVSSKITVAMFFYIHKKYLGMCVWISPKDLERFVEHWIIRTEAKGMFHSLHLMVSHGGRPVGVNYTMKRGNVIGALLDAHERHLRLWSSFQWAFKPVKQSIVTGNKLLQMNRPVVSRPNKNDHRIPLGFSKKTDCREDECKSTFCWTSSPKKLWDEVSGPSASISAWIPMPI